MNIKRFIKSIFYTEDAKTLPIGIVSILFTLLFFNSMTMTMVFSYLPQMVKSFGISEDNVGYKSGLIASALFVSRSIFSLLWGYISDKRGKKFTVIATAIGIAAFTLAFGFSTTFYWALVTRCLQGTFMGLIIVCKAIMGQICDDSNMATGISFLTSSFTTGLILGPSIGGFLVFPAEQYPTVFGSDSIFAKFSVLLPNLILVVGLVISTCLSLYLLPADERTRNNPKPSNCFNQLLFEQSAEFYVLSISNVKTLEKRLKSEYMEIDDKKNRTSDRCCRCAYFTNYFLSTTVGKALSTKECLLSCIIYATYSVVAIGYGELFPVFAATTHKYHGYEFTTSEIGLSILIVALICMVIQMTTFGRLIKSYGAKNMFIFTSIIMAVIIPMNVPLAYIKNKTAFWAVLTIVTTITRLCIEMCFLVVNIFLTNSVQTDLLGSANGLGMTFSSVGRAIAPTLYGSMYSWSLQNIKILKENHNALGFPFNQYFAFLMMSLCSIFNAILVSRFPNTLNYKKIDVTIEEEEQAIL